jgi:hypothetical protein
MIPCTVVTRVSASLSELLLMDTDSGAFPYPVSALPAAAVAYFLSGVTDVDAALLLFCVAAALLRLAVAAL